jgi:hypothetical protein
MKEIFVLVILLLGTLLHLSLSIFFIALGAGVVGAILFMFGLIGIMGIYHSFKDLKKVKTNGTQS